MSYLQKYAVADHIRVPLRKAGSNNHAVGADWTPVAGDVKISIDGGAAANVANLPTAIAMGNSALWDFNLTSGELTGKRIQVTVADSVTKAVEDDGFTIDTYGNASAQIIFDFSQATPAVNLTQVKGSTAHATTFDNWLAQDVSGTATSGTTTTLVDAARTEADTDYWKGSILLMTSGSLAGQARKITAFNAGTHTITVSPAFTQAVATQTYSILPDAGSDVIYWNGAAVAVPAVTGVPKVDVADWIGSAPNALVSGRVDASIGAYASGQAPLQPTVAGRTLDVAATGEAGLDFNNINDAAGGHTLTNITVPTVTTITDLTSAQAEPGQGTPAANASPLTKLAYIYKAWRNKKTQTSTTHSLFNSGGSTVDQKSTVSDDGTTATRGEIATGP